MLQLTAEAADEVVLLVAQQLVPQLFFRDDHQLPGELRHAGQILGVRVPQHAVVPQPLRSGGGKARQTGVEHRLRLHIAAVVPLLHAGAAISA